MKEKELADCDDELNKLVETNQNLRQRNRRLQETRLYNMERASDEYKSFSRDFNSRENCAREHVLNELKDLWRFKLNEEKSVIGYPPTTYCTFTIRSHIFDGILPIWKGLKRDLKRLERDINDEKRELHTWTEFRDHGQHQLSTQIRLLKKELEDMNANYKIMSESIRSNTANTIETIKSTTEESIQKKNKSAAQVQWF